MNITRKVLPILALTIVVVAVVGGISYVQRTGATAQHFSETGRTVREPFLSAYHDFGGLAVLGYPISEAFTDERGTSIQYFQNVRLEQTPQGIQLGTLGNELGLARAPGDVEEIPGTLFPETGHVLASAFSTYYGAHGGEAVFGLPISPARTEGDLLVQDFERVRLVLDTDMPSGQQVRLGNLGSIALAVFPPTGPAYAAPPRPFEPLPMTISASLSVAHPTLQSDALQTVYLYVVARNEENTPVEGAQALVGLTYEGGAAQIEMPPTDENGISGASFPSPPAPPGTSVMVEAHVVWGDAVTSVSTIYLQWW
jgi:hypothetical protein